MDLSLVQDVFHNIGGMRNAGQFRIDITQLWQPADHDWGVKPSSGGSGDRSEWRPALTNAAVDAQGRATYRLAVANGSW